MLKKLELKLWGMLWLLKNDERGQSELLSAVGLLALVAAIIVIVFPTVRQAVVDAVNRAVSSVTTLF